MKLPDRDRSDFKTSTRFVLTRLSFHALQIYTPSNINTGHPKVILAINRGAGKPLAIDLSQLTEQELLAFRETVLIATEVAQPICAALDLRAQEAMKNGDDTDPRTYRQVPVVFVRPRSLEKYDRRILDRREDVLQGMQFNLMSANGVSESGRDLDELIADKQAGAEDNP